VLTGVETREQGRERKLRWHADAMLTRRKTGDTTMRWAIWGHLWTDVEREGSPAAIIDRCRDSGISTYLPHTYPIEPHPQGYFSPGVTYAATIFAAPTHDLLTPLLSSARGSGVDVQPWLLPFVTELHHDECHDDLFPRRAYQSAEFVTRDAGVPADGATKDGRVLCPTWPENRARAVRNLHDLIEQHGADLTAINLDMVRYPNSSVSWDHPCHCEACRQQYRTLFGADLLRPQDLQEAAVAYQLARFRNDCVRSLVQEMRDITRKAGLRLTVSARARYHEDAVLEGQDWVAWSRDGLVDAVMTMNYSTDRQIHRNRVEQHGRLMGQQHNALHYGGVGRGSSNGVNSMDAVLLMAQDCMEAGGDGVSLFHYNAMEDVDFARLQELS
jgi:uncharacterized lipoprotein YddW (UPF0748 family)